MGVHLGFPNNTITLYFVKCNSILVPFISKDFFFYYISIVQHPVSERLLFNVNSAIFQLYHGENKLIFNEMMMKSALFQINTLSWIFIVLAH
jgi:hypothetical protein